MAACTVERLAACVSWYGMLRYAETNETKPASPLQLAPKLGCPYLGLFGAVTPGNQRRIRPRREALRAEAIENRAVRSIGVKADEARVAQEIPVSRPGEELGAVEMFGEVPEVLLDGPDLPPDGRGAGEERLIRFSRDGMH